MQDTSKDPTRLLDTNVGYQPVVGSVSYGALLQVTPTLVPDSEFVVLAREKALPLVTSDRRLLAACPDTAVAPLDFVAGDLLPPAGS